MESAAAPSDPMQVELCRGCTETALFTIASFSWGLLSQLCEPHPSSLTPNNELEEVQRALSSLNHPSQLWLQGGHVCRARSSPGDKGDWCQAEKSEMSVTPRSAPSWRTSSETVVLWSLASVALLGLLKRTASTSPLGACRHCRWVWP